MRTDHLSRSIIRVLFTPLLLAASAPWWAHAELIDSLPADNEQLLESPDQLQLTFGDPVQLTRLALTAGDGTAVPLDFGPSALPSDQHDRPLPDLDDGQYTMQWSALNEGGQSISGQFSFRIDSGAAVPDAETETGAEPEVEPEVETGAETGAETEAEPSPEPQVDPGVEAEADAEPDTEAEIGAQEDPEAEAEDLLGPNG